MEALDMDIPGLISVLVAFVAAVGAGILAAKKSTSEVRYIPRQGVMLADRDLGIFAGIFTFAATWAGGGLVFGTAQIVAAKGMGLVWCQAPIGYAISLIIGSLFFADKMRKSRFRTMLDPFEYKYGRVTTILLFLSALIAETLCLASVINALGASMILVFGIEQYLCVIVGAAMALLYTLIAGVYSVIATDILQLMFFVFGLLTAVRFVISSDAYVPIFDNSNWLGGLERAGAGLYIDLYLVFIFGGIPWQSYWQRALSASRVRTVRVGSIIGSLFILITVLPSVFYGAFAYTAFLSKANVSATADYSPALPLVVFRMPQVWVACVVLGVIFVATVVSSDSSLVAASGMFSYNVFDVIHQAIHKKQPPLEVFLWVNRGFQVVVAALACLVAVYMDDIYFLMLLGTDLAYVVLFPQLLCVLYIRWSNAYGSLAGYFIGLLLRFLAGEPRLDLPAVGILKSDDYQLIPFRTLTMLVSLGCILLFSFLSRLLFTKGILPPSADVLNSFQPARGADTEESQPVDISHTQNTGF